jgi:flavin reductase (DIM6/NTAB) family NADH-FMN oxidoreductase RutF
MVASLKVSLDQRHLGIHEDPLKTREMIRRSQECVINVPTTDLVNEVIGIGDCSGAQVDKFKAFGLAPDPAAKVSAPLIKEWYANFECRLANSSLISKYNLFIWEVCQSTCGKLPEISQDRALPGSRRLHDLRRLD